MDGDGRLVLRARLGDRLALDEIYDRYADAVHTVCLHVLGDVVYARTATQTTFALAVQGRLSPLSDPERLCDWLAELARAASLNQPLLTRQMHSRMTDGPVARDLDPIALLRSAVLIPAPPTIRTALARTFDTMAAKLAREAAAAGLPPVASLRPPFAARALAERHMVDLDPATGAVAEPAAAVPAPAGPVVLTRATAAKVDLVKRPVGDESAVGEPAVAGAARDAADAGVVGAAGTADPDPESTRVGAGLVRTGDPVDDATTGEPAGEPAGDGVGRELVPYVPAPRPRTAAVARPTLVNGAVVFPTRYPVEEDFFDGDTGPLPMIARTAAPPLPLPRDRYRGWDVGWMPVARDDAATQARSGPRFADVGEHTMLADVSRPPSGPRPPTRPVPPEFRLRPALTVAASLVIAIAGVTTAVNWPSNDLRSGSLRPGVPDVVAVVPAPSPSSSGTAGSATTAHGSVVAGTYTDVASQSGLSGGAALAVPMPFGSSTGGHVVITVVGGRVLTTVTPTVGPVIVTQNPVDGATPPVTVPPGGAGPVTDPPVTAAPVTDQPAPPVTDPPVTPPPVTDQPAPPVTDPPVTPPPVTDEPAPPATDPPVTDPPVQGPVTEPPVTAAPAPVTEPPVVTEPTVDPSPSTAIAAGR